MRRLLPGLGFITLPWGESEEYLHLSHLYPHMGLLQLLTVISDTSLAGKMALVQP